MHAAPHTVEITTALGRLLGEDRDGLRIFRGIPYGEPLQGLNRVRRPQPVKAWPGIREALAFGPAAPQPAIATLDCGPIGDDCLSLNLWAPTTPAPLPVMVWIHGGGFFAGSSAQTLYDGARLARDNQVVVVTLNYRLGILGFGWWDEFPEFAADSNNGLRDQLLALHWVRRHIADFGGDPQRVTLFGESAGGVSVACLMASPLARGLFQRAIVQSGNGDLVVRPSEARKTTRGLTRGAGDLAAALGGDLATLLKAQRFQPHESVERGLHDPAVPIFGLTPGPVIGDDVLPEHPHVALARGACADIPLITGTTTHEWNLFHHLPQILDLPIPVDAPLGEGAPLEQAFELALPGRGAALLRAYRVLQPGATADELFCALQSDLIFRIPAIRLLEARASARAPTWSYIVDWPCRTMPQLQSCHVMDIPFVFGCTDGQLGTFLTGGGADAAQLSVAVRAAWAAFAYGGAPAAAGLPAWPTYDLARRATLSLAARPGVIDDPGGAARRLWDGLL